MDPPCRADIANCSGSYQDTQDAASVSAANQEDGLTQESSVQSQRCVNTCGSSCRARRGLAAFATGYVSGTLSLGEERPAVFPAFSSQPANAVVQSRGTFTLADPGTYQITAIVNIPAQAKIDATLHLTANGEIIPGSVTHVSSASHTGTYVLSAVVISDGSATATLTTSQDLTFTGAGSADVLAEITFLRLA